MKFRYFILSIITILGASSCEDVLDTKTTWEIADSDVWRVPELAVGVLHKAYDGISGRPDSYGNNFLDCATDNAVTNSFSSSVYKISMGGITAFENPIGNWSSSYNMIQYINSFLENGLSNNILYNRVDSDIDKRIKDRLRGEAYFLRAWWHFELLKMYGGRDEDGKALGVPFLDHFISQEEAAKWNEFVRPTYQETIDDIVKDLDDAIELLPLNYDSELEEFGPQQIGRANKKTAYVLKSRVLIYSASPAYQDCDVVQINDMGNYTILNKDKYENKWKYVAQEIAKLTNMEGMAIFTPLSSANLADVKAATVSSDIVFYKYFNNNSMEKSHFPPFYYGSANTVPSLNLVEAFCRKSDGKPLKLVLEENPTVDINDLYSSLDNRFNMNIYYHGKEFADSKLPLDIAFGGKDSQSFSENASRSGFYLAKYMSAKSGLINPINSSNSGHVYPLLRILELYMNFAEAANEGYGPTGAVPETSLTSYNVISDIRMRSGGISYDEYLENNGNDKDGLRTIIQNERRVEFAFENHRFFDMRRCLLKLDEPVFGVKVVKNNDGTYGSSVRFEIEERKYQIKNYFSPLPYPELVKNSNLVNNYGWTN